MASLWQKTMFYLGLVDDEEIAAAEAEPADPQPPMRTVEPPPSTEREPGAPRHIGVTRPVAGRRVEPPAPVKMRLSENSAHAEAGVLVTGGVSRVRSTGQRADSESAIIEARTLSDAQTLADYIREGRTVVLDLRDTEAAMVRRLVDFSSGLTYALDGRMVKVAKGVILVTPADTTVSVEERRRLAALGLYDATTSSA